MSFGANCTCSKPAEQQARSLKPEPRGTAKRINAMQAKFLSTISREQKAEQEEL